MKNEFTEKEKKKRVGRQAPSFKEKVVQIGVWGDETVVLTDKGRIFGWKYSADLHRHIWQELILPNLSN